MRALLAALLAGGCMWSAGTSSCLRFHAGRHDRYAIAGDPADADEFLLRLIEDKHARDEAYAWDDWRALEETWTWLGWGTAIVGSATATGIILAGGGRTPNVIAGASVAALTILAWPIGMELLRSAADRHLRRAIDAFNADAGDQCRVE